MEGGRKHLDEAKNLHHLWGAGDHEMDAHEW